MPADGSPCYAESCEVCQSNGVYHNLKNGKQVVICPECPSDKNPKYPKVLNWNNDEGAPPTTVGRTNNNRAPPSAPKRPGPYNRPPPPSSSKQTPPQSSDINPIMAKMNEILDVLVHYSEEQDKKMKDMDEKIDAIQYHAGISKIGFTE